MPEGLICTVVSLVPFDLNEEKPGLIPPRYHIPASDGKEPQVLVIGTAGHFVYLDETRGSLPVRDPADEVARSIVDDYISSQLRIAIDARPALFWVVGGFSAPEVKIKFKERLESESKLQHNWFVSMCKLADDDWNKYHQHNVVSDFQRKVAHMIGWRREEHEWMEPATTFGQKLCPSCATPYKDGLVICQICRCILDPVKHKTLQFA